VQLRRVASLGTGHTPSRQHPEYWEDCTIPWLTLADVWQLRDGTRRVIAETAERISELGLANSAAELHPAGTVALSRTASVGFTCILGRDMATSQDFATWTCGPRIVPAFLLWALRGTINDIVAATMGSTHKTIYMPDLQEIAIPLPSLEAQVRAADFLDIETALIDTLIEKKRRMIGLLKEAWRADLAAAFDPATGVRLKHLLAAPLAYGVLVPEHDDAGVPMLRITDLRGGRIDLDTVVRIATRQSFEYRRTVVGLGDLIVSVVGTLGRSIEVEADVTGCNLNRALARVQLRSRVPRKLIRFWFESELFADQARLATSGDSAQPTLGLGDMKNFVVGIPADSSHWPQITAALARREARIGKASNALRRQIDLLRERRQGLITAAITGELDVSKAVA
jgi:type I restriction enzyme S subunit